MKIEIVQYIKEPKGLVGCLLAIKNDDKVYIGWSRYNREAEEIPFSQEKAKGIAFSKAVKQFLYTVIKRYSKEFEREVEIHVPNFPPSMKKQILLFVERAKKYFHVNKISNFEEIKKDKTIMRPGFAVEGKQKFQFSVCFSECCPEFQKGECLGIGPCIK